METIGTDVAEILKLKEHELVEPAFRELVALEGTGIDPDAGLNRFYLYRAWYLRKWAARVFKNSKDELYEKVCVEFDYCAKVKKHGKNAELLLGLLDVLLLVLGNIAAALLAWMLKKNLFDRLCDCEKS